MKLLILVDIINKFQNQVSYYIIATIILKGSIIIMIVAGFDAYNVRVIIIDEKIRNVMFK